MRSTASFSPSRLTASSAFRNRCTVIDSRAGRRDRLDAAGPAPPPTRSTRSAAVRNSFCTTARLISVLSMRQHADRRGVARVGAVRLDLLLGVGVEVVEIEGQRRRALVRRNLDHHAGGGIAAGQDLAERQLRLRRRRRAAPGRSPPARPSSSPRPAAPARLSRAGLRACANAGTAIARRRGMQMRYACAQYSTASVTFRRIRGVHAVLRSRFGQWLATAPVFRFASKKSSTRCQASRSTCSRVK